jgi:hypothetical protein
VNASELELDMSGLKTATLLLASILLTGQTAFAAPRSAVDRSVVESLLEGPKIVNIVDDFLVFWDAAKGKTLRRQRRLWKQMVESKHRNFFDRAVYRNADPAERRAMLNEFLMRVPFHVEAIRKFNETFSEPLVEALVSFKHYRFREYRQQHDIYIGLSLFSFDGSVRPLHNDSGIPDTLCLGAEVLADYTAEQVKITIAHEFFHLYHFSFLFEEPWLSEIRSPHMALMIEGMAVAGTEEAFPFKDRLLYLHFSEEDYLAQTEALTWSSERYLELIRSDAPPAEYEKWFTNEARDRVPPRGGYLLGYELTKRIMAIFTLEQMVRMTPAQLREHAEEQLSVMAGEQLLMAGLDD